MPTMTFPYNPLAILKPNAYDDGDFKQYVTFVQQLCLQMGWIEQTDTNYFQPFNLPMAFSTSSNAGVGTTTGGTLSGSQYPNNAMDNNTGTYWASNGQPVLNGYQPSIGYDAGYGNALAPIYYNLWLQGAANATDPLSWVLEYADTMDTNYHWAGASWTPVDSCMNVNTTAGALSVASVSLATIAGTGYIINTWVSSITSAGGGKGAVIQPVVTPGGGAITGFLIADPGVGYSVGDTLNIAATTSTGSGATATVGSVNLAGQIQTITLGSGGSAYLCNPTATGSGGTGSCSYAVFTTAANGSAGGILQVVPCVTLIGSTYQSGGGGYAYGTPPTITIAQASGGSTPSGAGTPTAKLTMTTGGAAQLNRYDIPSQFWASVNAVGASQVGAGPSHRAFRLRILANNSSTTSCYIYEFQLYNAAGTYVNNTPYRCAPQAASTKATYTTGSPMFKIFAMQDTIQGTWPCVVRLDFGTNGAASPLTPGLWITTGTQTDGNGYIVGPNQTPQVVVHGSTGAANGSTPAPLYAIGNGNIATTDCWLHACLFKSTAAEFLFHIERQPNSTGVDDTTSAGGVQVYTASPAGSQTETLPQAAGATTVQSAWSPGSSQSGSDSSTLGASTQLLNVCGMYGNYLFPPSRRLFVYNRNGSVITDATTFSLTDPYGNSITAYATGNNCTKVVNQTSMTNFRAAVKNTV